MGIHSTRLKASLDVKPKSSSGCILMALIPLLLLLAFFVWQIVGETTEVKAQRQMERRAQYGREDAVNKIVEEFGATATHNSASTVITLPPSQINMTEREAKELALMIRSRVGKIVRVETPAGQVLAEDP